MPDYPIFHEYNFPYIFGLQNNRPLHRLPVYSKELQPPPQPGGFLPCVFHILGKFPHSQENENSPAALGDINGIPRVLDAGQCNDSYSLAVIALKLKEIFGLDDVNQLPIVYNIAWYEQKAVIVLLALLALGVKHIHLGPTLPAFLSPNVRNVLIEQFGIGGISTVDEDIVKFLS